MAVVVVYPLGIGRGRTWTPRSAKSSLSITSPRDRSHSELPRIPTTETINYVKFWRPTPSYAPTTNTPVKHCSSNNPTSSMSHANSPTPSSFRASIVTPTRPSRATIASGNRRAQQEHRVTVACAPVPIRHRWQCDDVSSKPDKISKTGTDSEEKEKEDEVLLNGENESANDNGEGKPRTSPWQANRQMRRDTRPRPWKHNSASRPKQRDTFVETHYESYLPRDKWLQMTPVAYTTNHRYGQAFKLRKEKSSKIVTPQEKTWLWENDFQIWLFEKSDQQLDINLKRKYMDCLKKKYVKSGKGKGKRKRNTASPHADLFRQFHHVKLQRVMTHQAVLCIQRHVRGWLLRNKIKRLKNKVAIYHGTTWTEFVHYYKALLTRIQKRYGVEHPQSPFVLDEVDQFLDQKKRCDDVFNCMAIADALLRTDLQEYLNTCAINPTPEEADEALGSVLKGCGSRAEVIFVVDCSSSLDDTSYKLQIGFVKSIINSLHIGPNNVRVGYVPYNTDVLASFDLSAFSNRQDVISAMEAVNLTTGHTRTDLALKEMRKMFKLSRCGVPKTCILITDGASYQSYLTEREARSAKKEGVTIVAIGVGRSVDKKELHMLGSDRDHIFNVNDYTDLQEINDAVMRRAEFANCTFCSVAAADMESRILHRGLFKEEVFEVVCMICPPSGTGLKHTTNGIKDSIENLTGESEIKTDFDPCLKSVLKSKPGEGRPRRTLKSADADTILLRSWTEAMENENGLSY